MVCGGVGGVVGRGRYSSGGGWGVEEWKGGGVVAGWRWVGGTRDEGSRVGGGGGRERGGGVGGGGRGMEGVGEGECG